MIPALPDGWSLVRLEAVDSTNRWARDLAREGAGEGTVVWAGQQTAGRGRRGRGWVSPMGNLYLSVVLRPDCRPGEAAQLGFVACLALSDCLAGLGIAGRIACKWPNDLLIDGAKVAGVLLETEASAQGAVAWAVIGIGVNVESHPAGTPYPATDLRAAGVASAAPAPILQALTGHLRRRIDDWRGQGFAPVREDWLTRAHGLGGPIQVRLEKRTLNGVFKGLGADGTLLLQTASGEIASIAAGDVFPANDKRIGSGHAAGD